MKIINKIKARLAKSQAENHQTDLEGLEGQPDNRSQLPTYSITHLFIPIGELFSYEILLMISEEMNVPMNVVRKDLGKITKGMISDVTVCIEYPYVDEYYRDTYYSFYARKHSSYNRFCFRLSFFSDDVNDQNFYDIELPGRYYGYIVLRPTPRRVIGYTFLTPAIYKINTFAVCLCERSSFVKGRKVTVNAFPFSGQDGEMNSCAEVCITMMFDYFSRRYNKYSRVLPSQIASQLTDSILDRKQPSIGIDIDTIASIMNSFNVNTRLYYKAHTDEEANKNNHYSENEFKKLLHIYIESGFPIYIATETHAMLAIGRSNRLFFSSPQIITMNDSKKPYWQLQNENEIVSFVVPMPENILLDVDVLNPIKDLGVVANDYPAAGIEISETGFYNRVYLTTSRSYKSYIVNSGLSQENKNYIVSTAMPRFIWVCETIKSTDARKVIDNIELSNIALFDSTDYPSEYNHIIIVKTNAKLLIPYDEKTHMRKRAFKVVDSTEELHPFTNNLKGSTNNWNI